MTSTHLYSGDAREEFKAIEMEISSLHLQTVCTMNGSCRSVLTAATRPRQWHKTPQRTNSSDPPRKPLTAHKKWRRWWINMNSRGVTSRPVKEWLYDACGQQVRSLCGIRAQTWQAGCFLLFLQASAMWGRSADRCRWGEAVNQPPSQEETTWRMLVKLMRHRAKIIYQTVSIYLINCEKKYSAIRSWKAF